MQVVEQGKWNIVNKIIFIAVIIVQPLFIRRFLKVSSSDISVSVPPAVYAIIMIGTTISFAGIPSIKANMITPSSPKILPNGSRNSVQILRILVSPIFILASSHIISPAGIATTIALPRMSNVLSKKERTRVLAICGVL